MPSGPLPPPRHAFLLSWPLANLGGVNNVLRNLIREFGNGEPAPALIELTYNINWLEKVESPIPYCRLKAINPYSHQHPWRGLIAFAFKLPAWIWRVASFCREWNIQILNPHFVGLEHFSFVLMRRLGIFQGRVILSFHGSDIRDMLQSSGLERWLYRMMLRGADALVPCSVGLKEEILMLVPECAERTLPIQNGIDQEYFIASADPHFELPQGASNRKVILNIGAFEYKKGHDTLLRAFRQVKLNHPDTILIIAGQHATLLEQTKQLAQELGILDDITFLVDIPHQQVAAVLLRADLFVLSSRWEKGICGEGLAMALLEAAAFSKPVVSTLSCGVSELISDGETGLLVAPEQPDALAAAIGKMLTQPADAARMATALNLRVKQDFTWRQAYKRYLEIDRANTI